MSKKIPLIFCAVVLLFLLDYSQAEDIRPGIRTGFYSNHGTSAFIGGEILAPITRHWYINPNFDFIFPENATEFTFNFDFHYDFPTRSDIYVWAGGGPAILYFNPDGPGRSDTDFGVNLLMGIGFLKGSNITPYIQPKAVLSSHSQFSLAFGIRF
ncbi:MAG TPA: hypothetical protein VFG11_04680 [Acidobacteriota bacterium]|nr:hypothetical protein [Acidobacteriota bacterium]